MTAGKRMISSARWATGWLGLMATATLALGQGAADAGLKEKQAQALALEKRLPVPTLTPKASFDLSPARMERLQKYLPKTLRKLSQREPLNLLVLGDASALAMHEGQVTESFPGVFGEALAMQFFYTGGVQIATGRPASDPATIYLRTLTREDGSVLDAAAILESSARQAPVDVVLMCYGQADAGMQPPVFARALSAALAGAKALGAEVILCSPWLPVAERSESVLGLTRPLADVLQESAADLGVLHADLGDLSRIVAMAAPQTKNEGQVFEHIERNYREFFYQDTGGHFIPRLSLHRLLGAMIYKDLLEVPAGVPWEITGARAVKEGSAKLALTYTLKNTGPKALELTALPLIASGWKPVEAKSGLKLEAGATQTLAVSYSALGEEALPLQEAMLRLPVLVSTGSTARVEMARALVEPVGVVWGLETLFNQDAGFLVGCQLVNPGKATLTGSWQAEFSGQQLSGNVDLASEGTLPLNLRFELPKDGPAVQSLPLNLTVKIGEQTLTESRTVSLTRNVGLGQPVALKAAGAAKSPAQVTVTPKATAKVLLLTFDLPEGDPLHDPADGSGPAWQVELNLDARSYGKRLEQGSTAALLVTGKAADGAGKVHAISPWAFGNGYAANFNPKEIQAALSSSGDKRQIALTLPRTYLYLHEWALDNGNSQLGLNVRVTLQGAEGYVAYRLPVTGKPVSDVEALTVLELTTKPTARMTVDVE